MELFIIYISSMNVEYYPTSDTKQAQLPQNILTPP